MRRRPLHTAPDGSRDRYSVLHRGPESYRSVGGWFGDVYVGTDKRDGAVYIAATDPFDLPSPFPNEEVA